MQTEVLSNIQIQQKINRIAHQIIENTFEEEQLFIGSISGNGTELASRITEVIKKHSDQNITLFTLKINKQKPLESPIELNIDSQQLKDVGILLVDDVLNSGRTMQYALVKLLEQPTKFIKTVALVDRKHRRYPIKCDYVGLTLSTTLLERVEVNFEPKNSTAYLI